MAPKTTDTVPHGRHAELRWRQLGWKRRLELVVGNEIPANRAEAETALGYARRMLDVNHLWSLVGSLSAIVVVLALEMIFQGQVTSRSFVIAGAVALRVSGGLEIGGRRRARKLKLRSRQALSEHGPR
jgi:hypothetical protein